MSLYAKATPPKGEEPLVRISTRRQTAMAQLQKMLLVRNTFHLPSQRSGWVSSPLPPEPPANITGLVLHCGLTAQKTDLAGKSHISLSSLGEKSPTKKANRPRPPLPVLAQMHPVLPDISAGFRAKESTAQQKSQIYSYP